MSSSGKVDAMDELAIWMRNMDGSDFWLYLFINHSNAKEVKVLRRKVQELREIEGRISCLNEKNRWFRWFWGKVGSRDSISTFQKLYRLKKNQLTFIFIIKLSDHSSSMAWIRTVNFETLKQKDWKLKRIL